MSNELEITTLNEAEDGNVDNVPDAVSTGYQAQNTLAESSRSGLDTITITSDGAGINALLGGTVDVSGVLYTLKQDVLFSVPTTDGEYYVAVTDTTDIEIRSLELTDEEPVWDETRNAFYTSAGRRLLNKYIFVSSDTDGIVSIQPLLFQQSQSLYWRHCWNSGSEIPTVGTEIYEFKLKVSQDGKYEMIIPAMVTPAGGVSAAGQDVKLVLCDASGNLINGADFPRKPKFLLNAVEDDFIRLWSMRTVLVVGEGTFLQFKKKEFNPFALGDDRFVLRDAVYSETSETDSTQETYVVF